MTDKKHQFPRFNKLFTILEKNKFNVFENMYKYLFDLFRSKYIDSTMFELFFIFLVHVLQVAQPQKVVISETADNEYLMHLQFKYAPYYEFVKAFLDCLLTLNNESAVFNCGRFGYYMDDYSPAELIFKLSTEPYLQYVEETPQDVAMITENNINTHDISFHFFKHFVSNYHNLPEEELQMKILQIKYCIIELLKFTIQHIQQSFPVEEWLKVHSENTYVDIDEILNLAYQKIKEANPDMASSAMSFMLKTIYSRVYQPLFKPSQVNKTAIKSEPRTLKGTIQNFLEDDEDYGISYAKSKKLLSTYIESLFLAHNINLLFAKKFLTDINKYVKYFPSLGIIYAQAEKIVHKFNSNYSVNGESVLSAKYVMQIYVEALEVFGIHAYT